MLNELTLILAPGSAGKSSLALVIAAHMVLGKDLGRFKSKVKCKAIVYNGEDELYEQGRRLYAVCAAYGFDYSEVSSRIMLLSADSADMRIATLQGRNVVVNETVVQQLIDLASDPEVGLLVADPLIDIHEVDEGDNPQMNVVMRTLKRIVKSSNVAGLLLHHTSKAGNVKQEDRIGNMDIARGASGIIYKTRIALTLLNASAQDAEEYGLQEGERNAWVRLDDAKMNLSLASGEATWFRREGVKLPNGDVVGVLKYTALTKDTTHIRLRVADVLISNMSANGQASLQVTQAVALLKENEPLWANKTDAQIKQRLEGMFTTAVEVRGHQLRLERSVKGDKTSVLIVMQ